MKKRKILALSISFIMVFQMLISGSANLIFAQVSDEAEFESAESHERENFFDIPVEVEAEEDLGVSEVAQRAEAVMSVSVAVEATVPSEAESGLGVLDLGEADASEPMFEIAVGETFTVGAATYKVLSLPTDDTPGTVSLSKYTFTDYDTSAGDIIIENPILDGDNNAYNVTTVGESVFVRYDEHGYAIRNAALTSITLPSTVTTIENNAFKYTNISSFNFSNITTIGDGAFYGTRFTSLVIPFNVRQIGSEGFGGLRAEGEYPGLQMLQLPIYIFGYADDMFAGSGNKYVFTDGGDFNFWAIGEIITPGEDITNTNSYTEDVHFTVTFEDADFNDETVHGYANAALEDSDRTVADETRISAPSINPSKEGHTFEGWYLDKQCTLPYDFSTKVEKDFTLYPKFTPDGDTDGHTVTFETLPNGDPADDGDDLTKYEDVTDGAYIYPPGDDFYDDDEDATDGAIKKPSYWVTDPNDPDNTRWDFDEDQVVDDITLHPYYSDKHIVIFTDHTNNPDDPYKEFEVAPGGKVDVFYPNPQKPFDEDNEMSFLFEGWYTEPNGGGEFFDFNDPITEDLILYPNYIDGDSAVVVLFEDDDYDWTELLIELYSSNFGYPGTLHEYFHATQWIGDPADYVRRPVDPIKSGMDFVGWFADVYAYRYLDDLFEGDGDGAYDSVQGYDIGGEAEDIVLEKVGIYDADEGDEMFDYFDETNKTIGEFFENSELGFYYGYMLVLYPLYEPRDTGTIVPPPSTGGESGPQVSEDPQISESPQPSETVGGGESPQPSETVGGGESPQPSETVGGGESPQPSEPVGGGGTPQPSEPVGGGGTPPTTTLPEPSEPLESDAPGTDTPESQAPQTEAPVSTSAVSGPPEVGGGDGGDGGDGQPPQPPSIGEDGSVNIPGDKGTPDDLTVGGVSIPTDEYYFDEQGNLVLPESIFAELPDGEVELVLTYDDEVFISTLIVDDGVPLSAGPFVSGSAWSLFDLMMTVFGLILSIMVLRKKKEDEAEVQQDDEQYKKYKMMRISVSLLFVFNLILLFITQDFTQPMTFFDKYSIIFGLVALVQVIITAIVYKKQNDEDEKRRMTQAA